VARVPLVFEVDEQDSDCAIVLVEGSIASRPYRFVLDTGAARTHVVADDHLMSLTSHGQHRSSGVIGTHTEDLVLLSDLNVGPLTFADLEVVRINADQPGGRNLLGMDVIDTCASRFDFAGEGWELAPTGTFSTRWSLDRSARGHILSRSSGPKSRHGRVGTAGPALR
jgi:hypothetical protein